MISSSSINAHTKAEGTGSSFLKDWRFRSVCLFCILYTIGQVSLLQSSNFWNAVVLVRGGGGDNKKNVNNNTQPLSSNLITWSTNHSIAPAANDENVRSSSEKANVNHHAPPQESVPQREESSSTNLTISITKSPLVQINNNNETMNLYKNVTINIEETNTTYTTEQLSSSVKAAPVSSLKVKTKSSLQINNETMNLYKNDTINIEETNTTNTTEQLSSSVPAAPVSSLKVNVPFGRYDRGITTLCSTLQSQQYPWIKYDEEKALKSNITAQFNYCRDHRIGNGLSQYFFNRLIAAYAGINYELDRSQCRETESIISLLGDPLPLNISYTSDEDIWQHYCSSCIDDKYSLHRWPHGCRNWDVSPLVPAIKHEYKILAEKTLQKHPELEDEIDDVAIHLRLGDVLTGKIRNMGLLPFQAYLDIIPLNVSSIGIVTAPTKPETTADIIVNGLRTFLADQYPKAKVAVRNSPNDNASMVHTRLVKARQLVICTASTYCLHPTIGSEAVGVMFWNAKHPNWVDRLGAYHPSFSSPMIRFLESKNFPRGVESLGKTLVDILTDMNRTEYQVSSYEEWNQSILPYYKL